jgi:hypothetical protein
MHFLFAVSQAPQASASKAGAAEGADTNANMDFT